MKKCFTPPDHVKFEAQKLFGKLEGVLDGSIAMIEPGGGGPLQPHTHAHNHLFFVLQGQAKVLLADQEIIIPEGGSCLVEGRIPHSVWNDSPGVTKMLGVSVNGGSQEIF